MGLQVRAGPLFVACDCLAMTLTPAMSTAQQQSYPVQAPPAVADTQADKCSSCQRFCALDLTYKCEACRQHWCIDCLAAHLRMYAALQPATQPSGAS